MKADERHELQRNELEDYTAKLKPFLERYGRTLGLLAVAGVLLLVAVSVFANRSRAGSEAGWGGYFTARDAAGFEAVAELDAGTNAAVWARVAAGETYLAEANNAAYTDRAAADDAYAGARKNFQSVLDDSSAPDPATAKALYGMAAVEEATGGDDLAPAKARLEELIADYPSSPLIPVAEARLKILNDPTVGPFLAWLDTQDPTPADFARPIDGAAPEPDPGPALPARPAGMERIGTPGTPGEADAAGAAGADIEADADGNAAAGVEDAPAADGDAEPVAEADGE